MDRGLPSAQARPARTTVYDAFRSGRSRMNPALVEDIVLALGLDEAQAQEWWHRVVRARRAEEGQSEAEETEGSASVERRGDAAAPAHPGTQAPGINASEPQQPEAQVPEHHAPEVQAPEGPRDRSRVPAALRGRQGLALLLAAVLGGTVLNLVGHEVVHWLGLPLYLDMVGTGLVAMALGLWAGLGTALLTFGLSVALVGLEYQPFFFVPFVGAWIWAQGIHRWRLGEDLLRYTLLQLLVAVASTLCSVPVILWGLDDSYGGSIDGMVTTLVAAGLAPVIAIFLSNLATSVLDKLLTGSLDLIGLQWLRRRFLIPIFRTEFTPVDRSLREAVGALARRIRERMGRIRH